ncbi:MAG: carboxypeptidase regulatory-like domain-containing protein, partial [Hymenobacter sp.]
MKNSFLSLITLLTLAGAAHAQSPVSGLVQDAAGRGLPFATVVLLHLPDSVAVTSQTTSEQ